MCLDTEFKDIIDEIEFCYRSMITSEKRELINELYNLLTGLLYD